MALNPTMLNIVRDISGYNTYILPPSTNKFAAILADGVAQTICTVPGTYKDWVAIFHCEDGANIWVAINEAPALPTGTAGAINSEGKPTGIKVKAGDEIRAITSNTTAEIGVKLYALG
jgi:hypothetical protein